MDPNLLNRLDFFPGPNSQDLDSLSQPNAETSSAGAAMPGSNDGSLWDPSLGLGMSDEINPAFLYAQQNQGGVPYGSFGGSSRAPRPADAIQMATAGRRRDGQRDRKRTKVGGSEAAALESVDYWIHLDDDDQDSRLGGSFEIDFSRGRNEITNFARPMPAFNTMGSTPGLGTGLYTTANPSFFRNDFLDDAALDNALSEDEDGLESLNLTDQLSKIDTAAPSEVPPREGLYSTPLSWEKPQPGLRSDPLLSSFNPNTPLLSDMEQKNLLAIALNTNRPPSANFGPNYGTGFGFGYGYDALGGTFPTLGADALLESFGTTNLNDLSAPMAAAQSQLQPQSQPQPQPSLQSQAPLAASQYASSQMQNQPLTHVQQQRPQTIPTQQRPQGQQAQPQPQPQPQYHQQTHGLLSQPLQQRPKSKSPAQEQAQATPQPRQPPPPEPQSYISDQTQPQQPTAADKAKGVSAEETAAAEEKAKEKPKSGDRAAHNDIERKYRTNLKDKISELRDSVPALKAIPEEGLEEDDDAAASQRLPKVSKGTVMTKATEYIHVLERRNKAIMREHQDLSRRLQAFEQLLNATARQPFPMPSYSRTLFDPRGFC